MVLELSTQALIEMQRLRITTEQLLRTTLEHHNAIHHPATYRGQIGDWSLVQSGTTRFYEQIVTFTGSSQNINLDFPVAIKLRLIEQIFSDATSRDFSIKKASALSITAFTQLSTITGHTALSELDYDLGSIAQNGRLQFTYSNTTNGKTVTIRVTAEEIKGDN